MQFWLKLREIDLYTTLHVAISCIKFETCSLNYNIHMYYDNLYRPYWANSFNIYDLHATYGTYVVFNFSFFYCLTENNTFCDINIRYIQPKCFYDLCISYASSLFFKQYIDFDKKILLANSKLVQEISKSMYSKIPNMCR